MTARQPLNVGQSDLTLSDPSFAIETQSSQPLAPTLTQGDPETSEALTSLMGGVSGLIFTLSLIFFLQAPLISAAFLLTLASGWGGSAIYKARQRSSS